jgi:AraC family transcriptional activator of mtrCDE
VSERPNSFRVGGPAVDGEDGADEDEMRRGHVIIEARTGYRGVTDPPLARLSRTALERLFNALHVDVVELWECLVSPGWRLELPRTEAAGIHYNLGGAGRLIVGDRAVVDLQRHTLVIVPPKQPLRIEAPTLTRLTSPWKVVDRPWPAAGPDKVRKFVAGDGEPQVMLICGYFRVSLGASIDLFGSLVEPIVEQFDSDDRLDEPLKLAMRELVAQEVGMGAMTTALLKQVLVKLLRRSLSSVNLWGERFSILADPPIARAFAEMVARPGAPHSVLTLARTCALSRSAFMARFTAVFGQAPMNVLRTLRMRQAAVLLTAGELPIDSVAREVGYASRSSFVRAFRKTYASHPSMYRLARDRSRRRRDVRLAQRAPLVRKR